MAGVQGAEGLAQRAKGLEFGKGVREVKLGKVKKGESSWGGLGRDV